VEKTLGLVDILVNNAGIATALSPAQVAEADWHETIRVNLTSVFLVTQRALPAMRAKRWGRIINLSSVAAQYGGIVGPHYSASKAGILGLTRSYAYFLAKEGITVNAIAPALIETDMIASLPALTPDRLPVGSFGSVDEVARIAVLLAKAASSPAKPSIPTAASISPKVPSSWRLPCWRLFVAFPLCVVDGVVGIGSVSVQSRRIYRLASSPHFGDFRRGSMR